MELWKSNRLYLQKILFAIGAFVAFLIISIAAILIIYVYIPTLSAQSPTVRTAVQKVLVSKVFGVHYYGDIWKNDIFEQGKAIQQLSLNERLNFYLLILLNCELDCGYAYMYSEMISKDAVQFKKYLINYRGNKLLNDRLNPAQKKLIDGWIAEMDVIVKQNKW